jgi:hypothetical protein
MKHRSRAPKPDAPVAPFADQRPEKTDERGTVTIIIQRRDGKSYVKGSLIRSLTVRDAKVSEVFPLVYRSLFGKDPEQ